MLQVEIKGDREVLAKIGAMSGAVHASLLKAVTKLSLQLETLVKNKLTNQVLNVRSGDLRRSIFSRVNNEKDYVGGDVASSGDVKYAAIHEFGGTIKHPGGTAYLVTQRGAIFISNAKAAAMKTDPKRTRPHDIPMPERSFLRSSLGDMKGQIISSLTEAVEKALHP